MLKASENPPISWPEEESIGDFDGLWWVAHTKSRNEKALAHDLIGKNIHYFLPMNWKVRYVRGRKIRSLLPLFSGYLFFCGDEEQRIKILQTNRVANVIEVKNQEQLIHKPAILNIPRKSGRIIIFNFNPTYRYLNHHDFGLLFNAIMNWNDL